MRRVFRHALLRRRDVADEVDEELAFHLAMRESRLRVLGASPADATSIALARFGNLDEIRADCLREGHTRARTERMMQILEELRRDAQISLRSLWKAKGFTLAVVLTLALGIGANATVFSVVHALIFRPIAGVQDAERLFELGDVVAYPIFEELRERVPSIALAAMSERRVAVGRGGAADQSNGAFVSGSFFSVIGVPAHLGRLLNAADDVAGAPPVGVLSYDYWRRTFGADSSIIGGVVSVNGAPVTVAGIAGRDFHGTHFGAAPAILLPIHAWPAIAPSSLRRMDIQSRNWEWLRVIGRMPAEVNLARAQRLVSTVLDTVPAARRDAADGAEPVTVRGLQAAALPAGVRTGLIQFMAVLGGVVALVLLTACANVAGLLLSRAAYRERELAVRIAMGAGRGRLIRQLLTESVVLASGGGFVGIGAFLAARALIQRATLPGGISGTSLRLGVDVPLLAFLVAVTVLTGLVIGLTPALQSSRPDTVGALKGASSRRGTRQHALRGALVSAQVAVGLMLLAGTGLFARALSRAFAVDLGFRTGTLAMITVDPGLAQLDAARTLAYLTVVGARVAQLPGASGATWTTQMPLSGDQDRDQADIPGYAPAAGEKITVEWYDVGPRYHQVMGIPLLAGRGFDERDAAGTPPVVIINETTARRYFAGRNPVGARIGMRGVQGEIVGVARDIKYHELGETPRPFAWFPLLQVAAANVVSAPTLIVRTAGDPAGLLPTIVQTAQSVDPAVPVFGASTMTDRLREVIAPQLAGAFLLGVFSLLALVVAAVGIYGVVAYAVSQRTREIGIRMALGARGDGVVRQVIGDSLRFVVIGLPIGVGLAILLGRGMSAFLFGVGAADALTLVGTSVVMIAIGVIASYVPARRAVRVDPLQALRSPD